MVLKQYFKLPPKPQKKLV